MLADLQTADEDLKSVSLEELPESYRDKIIKLQTALPSVIRNIENFLNSSDLLLKTLGYQEFKRYLFIFQNNHEIRPTGGFIGSYAMVDIKNGNIEKIDVPGGGPYDLQGSMKATIESPLPLHIVNTRWEFQDANWFAHLPTSAEKLIDFFELSNGPTVDGLVFVNASLMQKILEITGPIELPDYSLTLSSDNFYYQIQKNVEIDYDKEENRPKKIIADLMPKLFDKLANSEPAQFFDLIGLFASSLNEKEIQFYFTNPDLERFVNQNNWGGQLKDTANDYLNVVSTNIAGEKTDAKIEQTAFLDVNIQTEGTITNKLTITKKHSGLEGELFYGVPNLDYLRIYVPYGSKLLAAKGFTDIPSEFFMVPEHDLYEKDPDISLIEVTKNIDPESRTEIYTEEGKTVFANWVKVEPQKTASIEIEYQLPFKLDLKSKQADTIIEAVKGYLNLNETDELSNATYSLLWQKQSGKQNFNVHIAVKFPKQLNYKFIYPNYIQKDLQTFTMTTELNTDKFIAISYDE